MIEQRRLEQANTLYTRLICVGEAGLKHEDGWQERLNYVDGLTNSWSRPRTSARACTGLRRARRA